MALNVMGSGVFLVFIALAAQTPGPIPDPMPHAMVLTGIAVSVCATGLALALADRVQAATGRVELGDDEDATDPAPVPQSNGSRRAKGSGCPSACSPDWSATTARWCKGKAVGTPRATRPRWR